MKNRKALINVEGENNTFSGMDSVINRKALIEISQYTPHYTWWQRFLNWLLSRQVKRTKISFGGHLILFAPGEYDSLININDAGNLDIEGVSVLAVSEDEQSLSIKEVVDKWGLKVEVEIDNHFKKP